jgi:aldehyde dehydrogenase (NAD+)
VQIAIGEAESGRFIADHHDIAIVSATGSVRMGQDVGVRAARRFARSILELGGNNAAIVTPSADIELALRATVFAATGTCGQRCTSLRRLIVHDSIRAEFVGRLVATVASLRIGSPLVDATHVGPLIDQQAADAMQRALEQARREGGIVHGGERVDVLGMEDAYYVRPAIVEMPRQSDIVREETFAPILYVLPYDTLDEAIALQNDVPQGLSSCIFTNDVREAERFQSARGSDCGIVNVNIGTSGAEIGGAFGGEKVTGGGRVSGSDSWKNYMRRVTATVNYSASLPLAQGVKFDLDID